MDKKNKHFISPEGDLEMKKYLNIDNTRIQKMLEIKLKVFNKEITPEDARKLVNETFDRVSAEEFAYGEQHLFNAGITDEIMAEGMNDILDVFKDVLVVDNLNLPKGHPIQTYADEATALEHLLLKIEMKSNETFIKNEWLDLYSKLSQINTHFSRKQHQLFSSLERKGFDRPSRIMWTFDDNVRDAIKNAFELLKSDKDDDFIKAQPQVIHLVRDILEKERDVLYPTSLKLISDEEFIEMRKGDDEIGYCLIENPPAYHSSHQDLNSGSKIEDDKNNLMSDLKDVLAKYGLTHSSSKDDVLDVSNGKLTLEQINLIYKHMKIDLSYVDENDIVKFYTDSTHRVFPRSPGVIGREVQNCHPRASLSTVVAIIDAFRKGEQDEAEFWIDSGDKFIYIVFNAVRDGEGNFKGVLEMMQDVTHIRSLKGSRRLLSWDNSKSKNEMENKTEVDKMNSDITTDTTDVQIEIEPKTVIGRVISQYPFIKDFLVSLSPEYNRLTNPVIFKTMKGIATLDMISKVGGFEVDHLIKLIKQEIKDKQ